MSCPSMSPSLGFRTPKPRGSKQTTFSPPQSPLRSAQAVPRGGQWRSDLQLASPRTTILYPSRGGEIARIGPEEVRLRYGVDPNQVPDFIAFGGDPSDKLPGVAGVGPKRAAQLLRRYGTLDGVLKAGLFQNQADMLRLYRLIATAPLPALPDQRPTWASASTLARSCGLKQLADRLEEKA